MKVAVIGPVDKDTVIIDGVASTYMGGIPYYQANALRALGADVEAFITYAKPEEEWVENNFIGIKIHPMYTEKTLAGEIKYSKNNPDIREIVRTTYDPNIIPINEGFLSGLRTFDYVLLGPLFYENIPYELFEKLKDKNLVYGNFGIFNYQEGQKEIWKNPGNLARMAPFLQYLFLDEREVKFGAERQNIEESARHFLNLGVKTVVVTQGSKGSLIFTKDKIHTIPAFPPTAIADTTGAGDTYVAAFIFATGLFNDLQKQGEFAAMTSTMAIEKAGAFGGTLEQVMERLKSASKLF